MNNESNFYVTDHELVRTSAVPGSSPEYGRCEVILTKDMFIACYKKWIQGEKEDDRR